MSDASELFSRGWRILNDRWDWEQRQRKYDIMRNEGLRRRNKPFRQAADLHLKLIDQKVNQKKAFTLAQIFGQPTLATFVCMKQQLQEMTQSAQEFFTFEMKHRTNFTRVIMKAVDSMWQRGRGIVKAYVDPFDDYRIIHENVNPLYLIMPFDVNGFEDSYEWVHVRQMNVAKFRHDRRWCPENRDSNDIDAKTLKRICGGKDAIDRLRSQRGVNFEMIELDKELREGYTYSESSDTIIVWEHYIRTINAITVYSYCPVATDVCVRKPFGVPYKVNGRVSAPFFELVAEVKDDGYYNPRGLGEQIADHEIYGCKVWNAKADMLSYTATPLFTSDVGVQNPANYRMSPGEVLPPGVKPAQFANPPMQLDQEINFARGEAEITSMSPDLGIEKPNQRGQEKRTAKEVSVASSISQVGQSSEGMICKDDLSKLYAHDWGLMLQYKRKELAYFISDDLKVLPEQALHGDYLILAGGATDDWDKNQRIQRASSRYEALVGKPNVNQDELLTELLSADDARLVKKLLVPSKQKQATEASDENTEINDMCPGPNRPSFPIHAQPQQDHFTRAQTILAWIDAANKMGTPRSPAEFQRLVAHLGEHVQLLKKQNPQQYKQIEIMIHQLEAQSRPQPMPMRTRRGPAVPPMRPATNGQPMRMI